MACLGDTHRVNVEVCALLGVVELKRVVFLIHSKEVTCVVRGDSRRVALHLVEYLVHDVSLKYALLVTEPFKGDAPFRLIGGIDVKTEEILRGAERVTGVVELKNVARILFVPHKIPRSCIGFIDHVGVIYDTDHAVEVGNGVHVALVVVIKLGVGAVKLGNDILDIGNVRVIKRGKHVLLDKTLYHVVGGDDDVIADCPCGELCVHILV